MFQFDAIFGQKLGSDDSYPLKIEHEYATVSWKSSE